MCFDSDFSCDRTTLNTFKAILIHPIFLSSNTNSDIKKKAGDHIV